MTDVVPYDASHLPGLVELANRHLSLVPPTEARLTDRAMAEIVARPTELWRHHYRDGGGTSTVQALVALERGRPAGIVLAARRAGDERGSLLLFLADTGAARAADALLAAACTYLRSRGCASVQLADRCPLGLGWFGVPVTWPHVVAALERARFIPVDYWIIMTGRTDAGSAEAELPLAAPEWNVLLTEHEDAREWRLELYHGAQLAAECDAWGIPPHLDGCPGFGDWVTIEWLGVEEPYRRCGFGRWLMTRQLRYHLCAGRRRVMLWTGPANDPARTLYHHLGFADGPETRIFGRDL